MIDDFLHKPQQELPSRLMDLDSDHFTWQSKTSLSRLKFDIEQQIAMLDKLKRHWNICKEVLNLSQDKSGTTTPDCINAAPY